MTIHVLIACSKSKSVEPEDVMNWSPETDIESWKQRWSEQNSLYPPEILYTGRSFQQQFQIVTAIENTQLHIISAGAGLISLPNEIPSYEATFRKHLGPKTAEWHILPNGGIGRLELDSKDLVVSFAPPQYHRALLNDPNIEPIASQLVVPSTSPLAPISGSVIQIHPRSKEVLVAGSSDLNTEFLHIYLSEGIDGFRRIERECENLPPKVERTPISDEDLRQLVGELREIESMTGLVRHLRDELLIKASVERISAARKFVRNE